MALRMRTHLTITKEADGVEVGVLTGTCLSKKTIHSDFLADKLLAKTPLLHIDRTTIPILITPTTRIPFLQINHNITGARITRAITNLIEVLAAGVAISISRGPQIEDSVALIEAEAGNTRICNGLLQVLSKAGLRARTSR